MRKSTMISLAISAVLALFAVLGVRAVLDGQANRQSATLVAASRTIVVAARPLAYGEMITAKDLGEMAWASETLPPGAFQSIDELASGNRQALAGIDAGEPVLASRVTRPGERASLAAMLEKGKKAVSIRVNDVLGVAGFIRPSDRVDVLLTRLIGQAGRDGSSVSVLLQGVKVLAVDQIADQRNNAPGVVKTVTIEVDTQDAMKLTLGANVGTLSLALRNMASTDTETTKPLTMDDLGGTRQPLQVPSAEPSLASDQLKSLETRVKSVEDDLNAKIKSLDDKLAAGAQQVISPPEDPESTDPLPDTQITTSSTVGVWTGTTREEHQVDSE